MPGPIDLGDSILPPTVSSETPPDRQPSDTVLSPNSKQNPVRVSYAKFATKDVVALRSSARRFCLSPSGSVQTNSDGKSLH